MPDSTPKDEFLTTNTPNLPALGVADGSTATILKFDERAKSPPEKPCRIGSYEIIGTIGSGGIGTVYEAQHLSLKRIVALKVLRAGNEFQPQLVERFKREMEAVGQIDHPNVVTATDAGDDEGVLFLAMERIYGSNLEVAVRRVGPISWPNVCAIVHQAALGLEAIRRANLVHRDLKPSNMILSREGVVKILDLGLARFRDAPDDLTPTDCLMGTMDFQAPEQAQLAKEVDIRADIYSLGCATYKLLTGSVPFKDALTPAQKIQAHALAPFPRFPATVPAEIAEILKRMVAKDRDGRFATPQQLADALEPHLAGSNLKTLALDAECVGERRQIDPGMAAALRIADNAVYTTPRVPIDSSNENGAKRKTRLLRFGLIGLSAILVAIGLAILFRPAQQKSEGAPDPLADFAWIVSKSSTDKKAVATLGQALAQANPGDRIAVLENQIEERLDILKGTCSKNVTIEGRAPSGRPVIWTPGADDGSEKPLLNLEHVEGLSLKGFDLRGRSQINDLIHLVGDCPGMRLENVRLEGFKQCGIRLQGCSGAQDRPIQLTGLDMSEGAAASSALIFAGPSCRFIDVSGCTFIGPMQNAAKLSAALQQVRFVQNRFANAAEAILFDCDRIDPRVPFQVEIDSNTFHGLRAGLRVVGSDLFEDTSRIRVSNNLFSHTNALIAKAEGSPPIYEHANWVIPKSKVQVGPYCAVQSLIASTFDPTQITWELYCDDQFKVWENGELIGESEPGKRYYRFDVTERIRERKYRSGRFCIQCENDSGRMGFLSQLTWVINGRSSCPLYSCLSTVTAYDGTPGWHTKKAEHFRTSTGFKVAAFNVVDTSGNVRDEHSQEGPRPLKAMSMKIDFLSIDPVNSREFLHYSPASVLAKSGFQSKPVGVPPLDYRE